MTGKDRKLALLELAKRRGAKGTGSSSSTTEPIAAPPLSVAPAEGPEPGKKRKRLVRASASTAAATAASTEEESSGSPLPGEIEVVEVEEGSSPPPCAQTASEPTNLPSPGQQLPPTSQLPSSPPAGQSPGPPAHLAGGPPPPLPIPTATAEGGGSSLRPSTSGANHENFSRVITLVRQLISNRELVEWSGDEVDMHLAKQVVLSLEFSTQHRKQLALEKRVKDLEHDKESLRSDFEAAQGSVELMRGMVEKARREYLAQVQETIKTEILMGEAVSSLDCTAVELKAETSSLRQQNTQLLGELERRVAPSSPPAPPPLPTPTLPSPPAPIPTPPTPPTATPLVQAVPLAAAFPAVEATEPNFMENPPSASTPFISAGEGPPSTVSIAETAPGGDEGAHNSPIIITESPSSPPRQEAPTQQPIQEGGGESQHQAPSAPPQTAVATLPLAAKGIWEPFTAKLRMMAEDLPSIISKAVESSSKKL
ncbi:uncharacterized protein [Phaseolus vulgaris]|uniref:uncharacterized protein n=1 Tax=Phaseolus vulgaris TaxID=3885 RepID=UPI0035CB6C0F